MGISRGGCSGVLEEAVVEANMLLTATRPEADTNGSTPVLRWACRRTTFELSSDSNLLEHIQVNWNREVFRNGVDP
jgi:hypothetical protein